jgi:DNA recombination protein RmuC
MEIMSKDLIVLLSGTLTGSIISWLIMKHRVSLYKESTDSQINRFEKEAVLMKENISSKEKHINSLTASVSEKEADIKNLKVKIDEQTEDIERMNERLKNEFKLLAREILEEKNIRSELRNNNMS